MSDSPPRKHPMAECEKCPLYDTGQFVGSDGPERANVAFIGEAPGLGEVHQGRPFLGPSGRLLAEVLRHHGIKRNESFLSNACLCRPPENATPPAAAIKACRPRLLAELQQRGVENVVALGNSAAQSLLATSDGVTKLRTGLGRPSPYLDGVRVISTFHPAACLRAGDFFPHLVTDVGKLNVKPREWQKPSYTVIDNRNDGVAVLELLGQIESPYIVIDIETDTEKDTAFDHPNNYELLCIGICYERGKVVIIERNALKEPDVLEALGKYLRSRRLIAQNGKYDASGLYPVIGNIDIWFDTMIASYVCDERPGIHGLGHQGVEILGTPDWKYALEKYNPKNLGYGVIPVDELDEYNAYDCATTFELAEYWMERLEKEGLRHVHDFLVAAANELKFVELNGMAVDIKYNTELMTSYLDSIAAVRAELVTIIGDPDWTNFNPNSPKQVKEVLEEVYGVTVSGTDKDVLADLLERATVAGKAGLAAFCSTLLRHRGEAKLYGTYIKGIRKRLYRGRVYPNFLVHGTTSGRLACRNPNMQNIPRASLIRKQFVPAHPENVFVSVDYSQAELRVLTYLAQEEYFRDIFNDGSRDLFNELRPVLYGDVSDLTPAAAKELRIRIKAYVYGLAYGREEYSIASEFGISVAEARRGMEAFFGVIPNIVAFQKDVERRVLGGEDLVTPFGRHRRFWLITDNNKKDVIKEALSFLPQSTASDVCLGAFTELRPRLKGLAHVRNLVHDNIMVECHQDKAQEVGQLMSDVMVAHGEKLVGGYVKFATDITIGKSWGEV
jgi:uracil-DNA glycosylase family 4